MSATVEVITARHAHALEVISGRRSGTGRHRPEDLSGLGAEVEDLERWGFVRLTRYGRIERLTRAGGEMLRAYDRVVGSRRAILGSRARLGESPEKGKGT
jgi:hypothetical protein